MKKNMKMLLFFLLSFSILSSGFAQSSKQKIQTKKILQLGAKIQKFAKYGYARTVLITVYVQVGMVTKKGYGSGAIISPDGYILTCAHVTEIGSKVEVTLPNGKIYQAKKLGKNSKQDYSLLKINTKKVLPFFPIGDSKSLKKGNWVLAFGHPGGPYPDRRPAISTGTITALNKVVVLSKSGKFYNHAIRTDVPIYMGNSGGPLMDLDGKLIGLNGAIILFNQNSYAVPIHQIMKNIKALKASKRIVGLSPSFLDRQKMKAEITPKDMFKIYKHLSKNFYRTKLGRTIKKIQKWWKKIFPKRTKDGQAKSHKVWKQ